MSSQHPQGQTTEGQGRTAVRQPQTPYKNFRPQSDPVDYDLFRVDQTLYHMSSIIDEARKAVNASRSKIALTEKYTQDLRVWCEDTNVKHDVTTTKLKEDYRDSNRQLAIARESMLAREEDVEQMMEKKTIALKNAECRAEIAEKKLLNLKKEKQWEHRGVTAAGLMGGTAENEMSNQIQDCRDSLISSCEGNQGSDERRQIPRTWEFVQISPVTSPIITSTSTSKKTVEIPE